MFDIVIRFFLEFISEKEKELSQRADFRRFFNIIKSMLCALVFVFGVQIDGYGATCTASSSCNCTPPSAINNQLCPMAADGTMTNCGSLPTSCASGKNCWQLVNQAQVPAAVKNYASTKALDIYYYHTAAKTGSIPSISFVLSAPGTYYVYYGDCANRVGPVCQWEKIIQQTAVPTVYTYQLGANNTNGAGLKHMELYRYGSPTTYNANWPAITFSSYVYSSTNTDYCGFSNSNYNTASLSFGGWTGSANTIAGVGGHLGAVFPATSVIAPNFKGSFAGTGLGCYGLLPGSASIPNLPPSDFFTGIVDVNIVLSDVLFSHMFYDCACLGKTQFGQSASTLPAGWFSNFGTCPNTNAFKNMFRIDNDAVLNWSQYIQQS